MASLWLAALSAAAGPIGIAVLVGVHLRDGFELGSRTTGVFLLLSGFSAILLSPTWGKLIDSWGSRRAALVSAGSVTALTMPLGLIDTACGCPCSPSTRCGRLLVRWAWFDHDVCTVRVDQVEARNRYDVRGLLWREFTSSGRFGQR
ncbi:MAG: hypothetical protein ACJAR2_003564 [Ilumatobacter sp.]|jgi:hypothetical protein